MIITGAVFGSIAFGVQGWNAWHNKKNAKKLQELQELFESEVQNKMRALAKEQFEKICKAKREIEEEEYNAQVKILKDLHQENLRSIEYLTSLDKWPLAVMPLVMRNDHLFFNNQDDEEHIHIDEHLNRNSIIPISIIFSPCRDKAFQDAIWKRVEEQLAQHCCTYWGTMSNHPIIFYQDAWKNVKDPADGSSFADIHAKIKNVPTIIISPIITRNSSLQFEISHWCIKGLDAEESYVNETRISFPDELHVYEREANYDQENIPLLVNDLCNFIESLIGFMSDQYMWLRYHEAPLLPTLVHKGVITCDESERGNLYKFYLDMLVMSLNTGDVNAIMDIDSVLKFCESTDMVFNGTRCFSSVVKRISYRPETDELDEQLKCVPEFNSLLFHFLFSYCRDYGSNYGIIHVIGALDYISRKLQLEEEVRKWIKEHGTNNYPWTISGCKNVAREFANYECSCYFTWKFRDLCQEALKSVPYSETYKAKYAERVYRTLLEDCVNRTFTKEELDKRIITYQKKSLSDVVQTIANSLELEKTYNESVIKELVNNVYSSLEPSYVSTDRFSPIFNCVNHVDGEIFHICYTAIEYWVETNFFSSDRIRSSIYSYQKEDLEQYIKKELKGSVILTMELYIEGKLSANRWESSSSESDFDEWRFHPGYSG